MALIKCRKCSKEFSDTAESCPNCGYRVTVPKNRRKSKIVAGFLCLFLWPFGAHELYLGSIIKAIIWIFATIAVTVIAFYFPLVLFLILVPIIQAIRLIFMSTDKFDFKYNNSNSPRSRSGCLMWVMIFIILSFVGIIAMMIYLPKLDKVYEKGDVAQALTIMKNVSDAQQRYYLKTRHYASTFDKLDLELIDKDKNSVGHVSSFIINTRIKITLKNSGPDFYVEIERDITHPSYIIRKYYNDDKIICMENEDSSSENSICETFGLRG